ncbi:proline-rich protein 18 [Ochotona curzoniae]|uniref:proline-rich protein 18 n=1 Tax=Ochotona curzoniae TaxID=130825 RepID=UPI001B347224|nr:proline-rich protein 18 [Ochotona curzoniae]
MPFQPRPPPAPSSGGAAARSPPRRPCAPPVAAAEKKRKPPERPAAPLSSSWPSATLKRPPGRRGLVPGPSRTQPPAPPRSPRQASPVRAGARATCATPRPAASGQNSAGPELGTGPESDDALRFSLNLTPEAILVIQRRHLEKQLLARPRRPFPSPSAPGARAKAAGPRKGGPTTSGSDAPPAAGPAYRPAQRTPRPSGSPRPADLRQMLKVSLLNERHRYDDVDYEEEPAAPDEGVMRKCTEWLRGVESAVAGRQRAGRLGSLPHMSTL